MDHIKPLPLLPHVNIMNDPEYRTECTTHLRYKTKSQNGYGTFPKATQLVSDEPGFESRPALFNVLPGLSYHCLPRFLYYRGLPPETTICHNGTKEERSQKGACG